MKKILILLLVVVMTISLTACGGGTESTETGGDDKEVYELKWAISWPATDVVNTYLVPWFIEEIYNRTDGRVVITPYAGGELLNIGTCYQGIVDGVADIGTGLFATTAARFPYTIGFDMPGFSYNNHYVSNSVMNNLYNDFKDELTDIQDVHMLWIDTCGPEYLYTNKKVETIEDLKGLTIRGDGLVAESMKSLGINPISVPVVDAYLALERNVIDGTNDRWGGNKNYAHGEVVDYIVYERVIVSTVTFYNVMNLDTWNSLPEDIQQVFNDIQEEAYLKSAEIYWNFEEEGLALAKEQGLEVLYIEPEEQQRWVDKIYEGVCVPWAEKVSAEGFPAEEFLAKMGEYTKQFNEQFPDRVPENFVELYGEPLYDYIPE